MQYHALSLSKIPNSQVYLLGLKGPKCHPQLIQQSNLQIHELDANYWNWIPLRIFGIFSFLLFAPIKILLQWIVLWTWLLFTLPKNLDFLLLQTPPAIPTLLLIHLLTGLFRRKCKVVVDFHNFGYTLLSPGHNRKGFVTRMIISFAEWVEKRTANLFGHTYHSFCVSQAMQQELKQNWNINATVLYDRPPAMFKPLTLEEKHALFCDVFGGNQDQTLFTMRKADGSVTYREDRPVLIVSSTSWTADEDFNILLEAVIALDQRLQQKGLSQRFEFVITGKGDLKEYYEQKMKQLQLNNCRIQTAWLAAENYPKLLASSDLGICLHYSSSGVDLPMKVVDMFGSGLPVCAIRFRTLPELVKENQNGLIFEDSKQLTDQIFDLFKEFPKKPTIDRMKKHLEENFQKHRWDDEWKQKALPVFTMADKKNQ
jgi:beta-1,4-mannosyltransferase